MDDYVPRGPDRRVEHYRKVEHTLVRLRWENQQRLVPLDQTAEEQGCEACMHEFWECMTKDMQKELMQEPTMTSVQWDLVFRLEQLPDWTWPSKLPLNLAMPESAGPLLLKLGAELRSVAGPAFRCEGEDPFMVTRQWVGPDGKVYMESCAGTTLSEAAARALLIKTELESGGS